MIFPLCILLFFLLIFKIRIKTNYSAINSFIIFAFVFYVVVPFYTYVNDVSYWGFSPFTELYLLYEYASWICLASFSFTIAGYLLISKTKEFNDEGYFKTIPRSRFYIILALSVLFQAWVYGFDLNAIFIRDYPFEHSNFMTTRIGYLINITVFKSVPTIIFVYIFIINKGRSYKPRHMAFLFLSLLVIAPPSQLPRFLVAVYYFPILYFFMRKYISFFKLMLIAMFLCFPALDVFRLSSGGVDINLYSTIESIRNNFKYGHFDAFQSVMMAVEFNEFSLGYSFLGAMLFFIPRVYWESKPIGSGEMIADELGLTFNNISMSLPGEFYINFHLFGVLLMSFFFGNLLANVDKALISPRAPARIYAILFVPLVFIVMRGDLFTSISYSLGILISVFVWHKILTITFSMGN